MVQEEREKIDQPAAAQNLRRFKQRKKESRVWGEIRNVST